MLGTLPPIPDLAADLCTLIAQIPRGQVATCGGLAHALGDIAASRWIGHFLLHHAHDAACHCHRVVRAGGALGGYVDGGQAAKQLRLEGEGIEFAANGTLDLARYEAGAFQSSRPLAALRDWQSRVAGECEPCAAVVDARLIAGLDVSYRESGAAEATCALVDGAGTLLDARTVRVETNMPYIPGYLAFRELPALLRLFALLQDDGLRPDAWMIDGAGSLHPRRMGIARTFGLLVRRPTVGVTKKLLHGRLSEENAEGWRPIHDETGLLGAALPPWPARRRPIYVSPGFGLNVPQAVELTRAMLVGRRLPAPIYWADRLSRAAARQ